MISKKLFVDFLKQYDRFTKAFERIEEALMGRKYSSNLYDSDWYDSVTYMIEIFLKSHFTEYGHDLIDAYLYEDCKEFWVNKDKTLFEDEEVEHYRFNTPEELYDVMLKFKNDYFLNND